MLVGFNPGLRMTKFARLILLLALFAVGCSTNQPPQKKSPTFDDLDKRSESASTPAKTKEFPDPKNRVDFDSLEPIKEKPPVASKAEEFPTPDDDRVTLSDLDNSPSATAEGVANEFPDPGGNRANFGETDGEYSDPARKGSPEEPGLKPDPNDENYTRDFDSWIRRGESYGLKGRQLENSDADWSVAEADKSDGDGTGAATAGEAASRYKPKKEPGLADDEGVKPEENKPKPAETPKEEKKKQEEKKETEEEDDSGGSNWGWLSKVVVGGPLFWVYNGYPAYYRFSGLDSDFQLKDPLDVNNLIAGFSKPATLLPVDGRIIFAKFYLLRFGIGLEEYKQTIQYKKSESKPQYEITTKMTDYIIYVMDLPLLGGVYLGFGTGEAAFGCASGQGSNCSDSKIREDKAKLKQWFVIMDFFLLPLPIPFVDIKFSYHRISNTRKAEIHDTEIDMSGDFYTLGLAIHFP